ncbi:hypothetical protein ACFJIV_11345 [Mucilaginibacter sp. UC70_90]
MTDYENELKEVVDFAGPIGASVEMVHISYPNEFAFDKELAEATLQKKNSYKISLLNLQRDVNNNLLEDIDHAVKISKPSLWSYSPISPGLCSKSYFSLPMPQNIPFMERSLYSPLKKRIANNFAKVRSLIYGLPF